MEIWYHDWPLLAAKWSQSQRKGGGRQLHCIKLAFFRWRFQIHIASNIRLLSKKHGGHQFLEDHVFVFVTLILFPKDPLHPPKSNIDTKNDPLENVSPASNMASFWVSIR